MPYIPPVSLEGKPFVILGAGTLGRRIAMMWLTQGEIVHLCDPNEKALSDASQYIRENLEDVIRVHVPQGKAGALALFQDPSKAIKNAWIVVEAVPEVISLKVSLLGELDAILPDDCILASNSSSYTGSEMFGNVRNRERFVNTHYYMPPQLLPIEIMPNPYTDPAVVELLLRESPRHGLHAYHVKESVGLLFNRIWAAIKRESLYIVAEGVAGAGEVDSIMKEIIGLDHGVFEMLDGVGLDVALDIEKHYAQVRAGQIPPEPAALLQSMVDAGTLGVKTGKGFYDHPPHAEKDQVVFLDVIKGEIRSLTIDGREGKTLIRGLTGHPDGVQIDERRGKGQIYWTSMGTNTDTDDGFLTRSNIDGSEVAIIIPPGATHTPKQLVLDTERDYLYWCDREGGRIQRCKLDGSKLETLYISASTPEQHKDQRTWCVGIALDTRRGLLYWTQKGGSKAWNGRIFRANIDPPGFGWDPANRTDVEILFDGLPEPIDLEYYNGFLYWTDRGDPPFGNSLNRADVSAPLAPAAKPCGPSQALIIAERFHEAIGLTIDRVGKKIYITDLLGSLWVTELDGSHKAAILRDSGNFAGITFHPAKSV